MDKMDAEAPAAMPGNRDGARYPLANDASGNPIEVSANAVAWRIRRGGGRRGRPRNVFDSETGRQLEIALGASLDDLIACNVVPDRYLLYPIDAQGQIIPGIVAVTEVPDSEDEPTDEEVKKPQGLDHNSPDPIVALAARQQQTIESLTAALERALGNATSGYAPVRPPAPIAPTALVMEQPTAPAAPSTGGIAGIVESISSIKPEQMAQLAMYVGHLFSMIKGGISGGPAGGAAPVIGGS